MVPGEVGFPVIDLRRVPGLHDVILRPINHLEANHRVLPGSILQQEDLTAGHL